MSTAVASILRAATRKSGEPLNILTAPCHERYESGLAKTNCRFWAVRTNSVKDWSTTYAPVPTNYILLNPQRGEYQLPPEIDFDVVLSQNKFGQFQILKPLSRQLHLPLISLEHTLPMPAWPQAQIDHLRTMRGDINVFISEFSREKWGWAPDEAEVIHHGIDCDTFSPNDLMVDKKRHILSVVNDWVNRDVFCGFRLWQEATKGLPVMPVGNTPGLSEPARSIPDLVMKYRQSQVFINTSLVSPVPTALLESMACGCAVVSTSTAMIPEVIEHGINGFMSNNPQELRGYCETLLRDEKLCKKLGEAARQTIIEKFGMNDFVARWNCVFDAAASIPYLGQ